MLQVSCFPIFILLHKSWFPVGFCFFNDLTMIKIDNFVTLKGFLLVTGEMALLTEGLGVGGETSIEEYIISPAIDENQDQDISVDKDQIKLYGPEAGVSWVARPVTGQSALGQSALGLASRQGSIVQQSKALMDPLVTLFGSVHEKAPETGSMRSAIFPNFGSMFSVGGNQARNEDWDEESLAKEGEDYQSDGAGGDSDDNLHSPLISRQTTSMEKDMAPVAHGTLTSLRQGSALAGGEQPGSMGIGGGWQLAWKWSEKEGPDGKKEGGFKRIYLHSEGGMAGSRRGSMLSMAGGEPPVQNEFVQASALVSQPALYSQELLKQHPVGPAMMHPSETANNGPVWKELFEPGVKHALAVGMGIQILQQVKPSSTNKAIKSIINDPHQH